MSNIIAHKFQFHKVRLKESERIYLVGEREFQFHKVRLKEMGGRIC